MSVCTFQHLWEPIVRANPGASQEKLLQLYKNAMKAALLARAAEIDAKVRKPERKV